jgi:peptidyl-prolyl cis-trans isomerase B (cyclophilin B)
MKALLRAVTALAAACLSFAAAAANPQVELKTSMGTVVIELYPDKAPRTVENFLQYAKDGFYDGTMFHRVIPGFMIQGGGFTPDFRQKPSRAPVRNEADNGLKNATGTVAMARTPDPHSATAQFFINVADNDLLDYTAATPQGWGYCVFGRVVKGMNVVERIVKVATGPGPQPHENVPLQPIVIERARLLSKAEKPSK